MNVSCKLNKIFSFSVFASSIAKVKYVATIRNKVLENGEMNVEMFEHIAFIGHCWRRDLRSLALGIPDM